MGAQADINNAIADLASGFTSRGTHGSTGVVKPDVAAPGDTIVSAGIGTGNRGEVLSGTSMATPHTAGIAALVKSAHPGWTVEQIKAAIMNTAGHDVWTAENQTGLKYGPARVGAGRVDSLAATKTQVLVYDTDTAGAVSASFGVVPASVNSPSVTQTRTLRVQNTGSTTAKVSLSYDPVVSQPGVSYTVSPRTLNVGGNSSATVKVTMTVITRNLRKTIDPTMAATQVNAFFGSKEARQYVSDASGRVLIAQTGNSTLRVPVYGAAKPVSDIQAADGKLAGRPAVILKGKGVAQGSGSRAFNSLTSVMQLGYTSARLPTCSSTVGIGCTSSVTTVAGYIRHVGAGSVKGATGYSDGLLWFGVSTWGDWATVGSSTIPYVDIDTTGDGQADYEVYGQNLSKTDLLYANLVDLNRGALVGLIPVNFNSGDVDTNVFDTNSVLIPVDPSAVGVQPGATTFPITYTVGTSSVYANSATGDIDDTPGVAFDVANPAIATTQPLHLDQGNVGIPYNPRYQCTANRRAGDSPAGCRRCAR